MIKRLWDKYREILMPLIFGVLTTIKRLWDKYREILMYLIFGVLTTVVSWATYALFTKIIPDAELFGFTISSDNISNVLSWICAVMFAYITNKLWVFNSKSFAPKVALKELWQFVSSRLATGVIEWVGFPILVNIGLNQTLFSIKNMLAKIVISIVVVILNYVFSKLFVFKNNEKTKKAE